MGGCCNKAKPTRQRLESAADEEAQLDFSDSLIEDSSQARNPAWKSRQSTASVYIVRDLADSGIKMDTTFETSAVPQGEIVDLINV